MEYQWYKESEKIPGASDYKLEIKNATFLDYEFYHMEVTGACNSADTSDIVKVWVADPLPLNLQFTSLVETVEPNSSYPMKVAYYDIDIPRYIWSYSGDGAHFAYLETNTNENTLRTGPSVKSGTITVEMEHVCGNRVLTQDVIAAGGIGIDHIGSGLRIFPNPVEDELIIWNEKSEIRHITVTSINGQIIYQSHFLTPASDLRITTSTWSKGVYLVRITSDAGTTVHKIIKK